MKASIHASGCKLLRWLSVEQATLFEERLKSKPANASTEHEVERFDGAFAELTILALLRECLLCRANRDKQLICGDLKEPPTPMGFRQLSVELRRLVKNLSLRDSEARRFRVTLLTIVDKAFLTRRFS
jgi:hypothetical protein